ncbi:hypothetical protein RGUI_2981 [Rhodovulum sp. P5]|nr:hypothetical protein RGUI_2981 [Rhodovulum sp. P5]
MGECDYLLNDATAGNDQAFAYFVGMKLPSRRTSFRQFPTICLGRAQRQSHVGGPSGGSPNTVRR